MVRPPVKGVYEHFIHIDSDTRAFLAELVRPVVRALHRLEHHMTTVNDALDNLAAQTDANSAALNDLVADVRALVAALSSVDLPADAQAKVDAISAKLGEDAATIGALDTEVGDADGSDTPAAGDDTETA